MADHLSVIAAPTGQGRRTVKKVPFVELFSGRVQGVISSGSDVNRVYVAFLEASTGTFYCCTNNNRQCGGLRSDGCKHLHQVIDEAIAQYSSETVASYLGLPAERDYKNASEMTSSMTLHAEKESPGIVFSRFLAYLRFCELEASTGSVPEMSWFAS